MVLLGGQFKSATHGQFKSAQGGQFDRILQFIPETQTAACAGQIYRAKDKTANLAEDVETLN